MNDYPSKFIITSGTGVSMWRLVSFDNALLSAGISNYNLVKVSSILPSGCKEQGSIDLREGSLLAVAYSTISSDVPGDMIASAVAVGIPENEQNVGVIMEYVGHHDSKTAELYARMMVQEAMQNHEIPYKRILSSSAEAIVGDDGFSTVVSALAFW